MARQATKNNFWAIAIIGLGLAILAWFFAAKVTLFGKHLYQSDLFSHIQTSRSWLQGRPAMFENNYGHHAQYHNYFFNLLLGPLVLWLGAYGLFVAQLGLYVWAFLYTFRTLQKAGVTPARITVFLLALFLGPYAFWLYDDTWFGFHIEMLYIPLGLLFALSLYKQQKWVSIVAAVFIIAIKEDGAVLAACLHLLYYTWQWTANRMSQPQWLKKSLTWGLVYVAVFVLGVVYLKYKNHFAETRLDKAFARWAVMDAQVQRDYITTICKSFALMQLPLLAWLMLVRIPPKLLLWWALLSLPVLAVNMVSGLVYLPQNSFSLTWVPRFSLSFTLFLAVATYSILQGRFWFSSPKKIIIANIVAGIALVAAQVVLLKTEVNYSFSQNTIGVFSLPKPSTTKPYVKEIEAVARVLPHDYPVAPPYWLLGAFHKHDYLWISSAYNAWNNPRMVICDETLWEGVNPTERLQHPDSIIKSEVRYYFEREDRHYLVEAGVCAP